MAKRKAGEKEPDPRAEERRRLKALAFSRDFLSRAPARSSSAPPLQPSKTLLKHQGADVVKKGQRKNRYLFSFPGFMAPVATGGKVGELTDLATGNPILYLEFPKGRMKLFGTIVYPKNRYLTLQFARKNVLCEDSFDSMVVFSDAWWIGTKEENPEEVKLEFPKELIQDKVEDCDFKGGAGAATVERSAGGKPAKEYIEQLSPDIELEDDMSDDSNPASDTKVANTLQTTPVRQSTRTAGKTLNYAEPSSGEESISGDADKSDTVEEDVNRLDAATKQLFEKTHSSSIKSVSLKSQSAEEVDISSLPLAKSERSKSERSSSNKSGTLVQATLSTLFQKVTEKKTKLCSDNSPEPKGSVGRRQHVSSKDTSKIITEPDKQETPTRRRKIGSEKQLKECQVQNDEIEDISSDSLGGDDSDEDWTT